MDDGCIENCKAAGYASAIISASNLVSPAWNVVIRNISIASSFISANIGTIYLVTIQPDIEMHNGLFIQNVTWDEGTAEDNFAVAGFWAYCDLGYVYKNYQCTCTSACDLLSCLLHMQCYFPWTSLFRS